MSKALSVHSLLVWVHLDLCCSWGGVVDDGRKGYMGREVVTERERREKESDGGRRGGGLWVQLSLSGRTSGTHRPITGALLISTQCALCQKSDTVRALWTSSPFKSTQRAFYVLNRGVCAHVMVCDCVLCSLSGGQRARTILLVSSYRERARERDERSLAHCACYCAVSWFVIETNMLWCAFIASRAGRTPPCD